MTGNYRKITALAFVLFMALSSAQAEQPQEGRIYGYTVNTAYSSCGGLEKRNVISGQKVYFYRYAPEQNELHLETVVTSDKKGAFSVFLKPGRYYISGKKVKLDKKVIGEMANVNLFIAIDKGQELQNDVVVGSSGYR